MITTITTTTSTTTTTTITTIKCNNYNHYSGYNDYRDSDLDLYLDWERFSDLVTRLTITDKLQNFNHDIEF